MEIEEESKEIDSDERRERGPRWSLHRTAKALTIDRSVRSTKSGRAKGPAKAIRRTSLNEEPRSLISS